MGEFEKKEIVTLGELELAADNGVLSSLSIPVIARLEIEVSSPIFFFPPSFPPF